MKHLKLPFFIPLFVAGFIAVTSFTTQGSSKIKKVQIQSPESTTITLAYTGGSFPTLDCEFTAEGGLETSGTAKMDINMFGGVFHCLTTFSDENGTFTIKEECNMKTWVGVWQVIEGAGAYANLRGGGSLTMPDWDEIYPGKMRWTRGQK